RSLVGRREKIPPIRAPHELLKRNGSNATRLHKKSNERSIMRCVCFSRAGGRRFASSGAMNEKVLNQGVAGDYSQKLPAGDDHGAVGAHQSSFGRQNSLNRIVRIESDNLAGHDCRDIVVLIGSSSFLNQLRAVYDPYYHSSVQDGKKRLGAAKGDRH